MTEPTNPTSPEEETAEVAEEQEVATVEETVEVVEEQEVATAEETVIEETVVEEEQPALEAAPEASAPEVVEQVEETVIEETVEVAAVETGGDVAIVEVVDVKEVFAEDEDEESAPRYVEGPAEYAPRERRGRGRRIGSDVRLEDIDYKNTMLLTRFLDRRGRVLSRRKTRVPAKVQRRVVRAIKRARHLALLPYTADQTRIVRKRR